MTVKTKSKKTFDCVKHEQNFKKRTLFKCRVLLLRLVVALAVTLGLFAIELSGFFSGVSMFNCSQGLLCIL